MWVPQVMHQISWTPFHTVDSKITAMQKFPTPKSVEDVFSFLGLACYKRAFVKNFASIASTLTCFLKKDVALLWNNAQQHGFTALKDALTHAPILVFPNYRLPFTMCMDTSALGIGAVLKQTKAGKHPHATVYKSHVFTSTESKYSASHLEVLAVVWALQHFRGIIFGYPVTVYMDHIAVTQLFSWWKPYWTSSQMVSHHSIV